MKPAEITAIFDQQASGYDQQWRKMAPLNGALHLLVKSTLSQLGPQARILCVGAGTGAEIVALAAEFPEWHFTAVEPSLPMLDVFRRKAEEHGISDRCIFHGGYLDTLPIGQPYDAATSFLVSQFLTDRTQRSNFFREIASRLHSAGILVTSDLTGDMSSPKCELLIEQWFQLMRGGGISPEGIEKMREAYSSDVAVLPADDVEEIIIQGGFELPVKFFQAGMVQAWFAKKSIRPSHQ